ncbi:MAG: hypothetical protein K6U14_03825 [Firmicutes bacterium]|nr:hypothetical protein [Alicyclobacillaceae bacterium]MCL6496750.1 hypothetical protein [Bacillota bacterium]
MSADSAPGFVPPMLAVPYPRPFTDARWWFEVKWDGWRTVVNTVGSPRAYSRRGQDLTARLPGLAALVRDLPTGAIFDGEIIRWDDWGEDGSSLFRGPVGLILFDCLYFRDVWRLDCPLQTRRRLLQDIVVPQHGAVRVAPGALEAGEALWQTVVAFGLEGMMAKRWDSRYRPGARSPEWRKVLNLQSQWFPVVEVEPYADGVRWLVADLGGQVVARLPRPAGGPRPGRVLLGYRGRTRRGSLRHARVLAWEPR